jgi:hypothetical protein
LAAAIRAKWVSPAAVVTAHLQWIDRIKAGLNAVGQLAVESSTAEARQGHLVRKSPRMPLRAVR